jgi:hypothetical protein
MVLSDSSTLKCRIFLSVFCLPLAGLLSVLANHYVDLSSLSKCAIGQLRENQQHHSLPQRAEIIGSRGA